MGGGGGGDGGRYGGWRGATLGASDTVVRVGIFTH